VVTVIWQFTNIWNDFLFGVVFGGPTSQPMTVALNNLVNSSTGREGIQRQHRRRDPRPCR
jgi:glucose/mannose transport system permease protein